MPRPLRRALRAPRLLVIAAVTSATVAAPAAAEVTFTFPGRGWGHGVGMSQYGARGYALNGWDARRILTHYYTGVALETRPAVTLRVLLNGGVPALTIIPGAGGAQAAVRPAGQTVALTAGAEYTVRYAAGAARLEGPGGAVLASSPVGLTVTPAGAPVQAGRRRFRGDIDVTPRADGLWVVNRIDSELYLRGVVPREMSASWGDDAPAALQAQAVAARTYAIAHRTPDRLYDVTDDTSDQVYEGAGAEDPRSNAAIQATSGTVLTHNGALINAMFSSTSGGHTESYVNVFGGSPVPYLVGVPDPYDRISPHHVWTSPPSFTASALARRLGLGSPVRDVTITARGVSPRAKTVRVTTADGASATYTGWRMRGLLGLKDSWFAIARGDRPATPASPAAPATPVVSQLVRRGRWLVVVQRSGDRRVARAMLSRLRPRRAGARLIARPAGRRATYLVVAGRYGTRAEAEREVAALRRLRFAARVTKAVAGDPVVRARRWPAVANRTAVPAPTAPSRFRVAAADVATLDEAKAVVARLAGRTPRPRIVSIWTPVAGTRYLVVTLTSGTADQARRERAALVRAGFPAAATQPADTAP